MYRPLMASGNPFYAEKLSDKAKAHVAELSTFELSNGIPVVFKRSTANKGMTLSLVIRGGSAAAKPGLEGLEAVALKAMAMGSKDLPSQELAALLGETGSSIDSVAGLDFSTYSLATLGKKLDRLVPAWIGTIVRPGFAPGDVEQVISEARLALEKRGRDPRAVTASAVNELFFAGHPYAASPEGTKESLDALDVSAVRAWYGEAFSANRIFIVAVGDFEPASLRKRLEAGLGSIPDRAFALPPPPPRFAVGGGPGSLAKREFPQSNGLAYLRGDFAAPDRADPANYMPLRIGMAMLSDLLLDVVRDGASSAPCAYITDAQAVYGSIVITEAKEAARIKSYIDEAVADLAAGTAVSLDPRASEGGRQRVTIEEALASYKTRLTTDFLQGQATNVQVANSIARAVILRADCRSWVLDDERIAAVSADQVKASLAKYLLGGKITWVMLGAADDILSVSEVGYESVLSR